MDDPSQDDELTPPTITQINAAAIATGSPGDWAQTMARWQADMVGNFIRKSQAFTSGQMEVMKSFLRMNPWYNSWKKQVEEAFAAYDMGSPSGMTYEYGKVMMDQQLKFLPAPLRQWVQYQLMHNPTLQQMYHGEGVAAVLEWVGDLLPGEGELHKPQWNGKFLTEDSHGNIRAVAIEEIDALFPRANGAHGQAGFPHIIITPSHAKGEKLSDMTDITHGVESLGFFSHNKPLKLAQANGHISAAPDSSLILFACDSDKNPFLNAAALMRRLDDLQRIAKTGEADNFRNVSPGAKRIAKLMLRCMAQNPNDVDVNDTRPLKDMGISHLALRARPELVAQHFQLIGYSKGGNVVSDAMRYLATELSSSNAEGKPIVEMEEGHSVRNLVRNIACMSIAALEVKMDEHYKTLGVRRISFNNEHDVISNHMDFESSWGDRKWKIEGVKENQGHDPKDALGIKDQKMGYVLQDKHVRRKVKEAMAPLYGKAAISSINFEHPRLNGEGGIVIGTAAGTPDELLMQQAPKIIKAMKSAGLHDVKLEAVDSRNGRAFVLSAEENLRDDLSSVRKLASGFTKLRDPSTVGLMIADAVMESNLAERITALGGGGKPPGL